ncbi:MAG: HAMP domain-containing histidine kinase [bacterium]|nr:HAMP domain-containing histidine kinase [bacterium]
MNKITTRALLARPLVIAAGAAASALVKPSLQTGSLLIWIVGIFGGLNLAVVALWWAGAGQGLSRHAVLVSPVVGLLGWGALATFTGGLESPFVAAIFFEIALGIVSMGPRGVLWVAANGVALLVLLEFLYGFSHGWQLLVLECLFVMAIGGLGVGMSDRRRVAEVALRTQGRQLGQRLEALQRELEDERVVSRVGGNVARLAHGLKNAVHSLRGFVGLIEPQLESGAGTNAVLAGLRTAIDDLEKLARMTLAEDGRVADASPLVADEGHARLAAVVEQARWEIAAASPDVSWSIRNQSEGEELLVGLGETTLLELLVILMRNAVEAMDGRGRGSIECARIGERCRLIVRDEGPGFAAEDLDKIFQPGFTTKNEGSGFGLFLARRIVEDHGGALELRAGEERGAVVQVDLPRVSAGGAE